MDFSLLTLLPVIFFASVLAGHGEGPSDIKPHTKEFGYDPSEDELGPNSWADEYKTCSGKYQSPIDIEESLVSRVSLPPLEFRKFDEYPNSASVVNNGHTVMMIYNFSSPASVRGGPLLQREYNFVQMHFHWGVNDSRGSEDLINNHSFAMELHMVFYNADYGNVDNASKYKDGLLVFAIFFEIWDSNPIYASLIDALPDVTDADKTVRMSQVPVLRSLLPENYERYFTYSGSLTTPPCLEVVTWIDFKHPVRLSHEQVEHFRSVHSHHGILSHNFRPVQPLSDRPVWYKGDDSIDGPGSYGRSVFGFHSSFQVLSIAVLVCIFNYANS